MSKHVLTFFPLGNADTTLIELEGGEFILWDYADMKGNDDDDKRCDLPVELNKIVTNDYDVVCFTHADEDHIKGFSEYFYLEHAQKYQDDERKKINELWVPAAVLLETTVKDEAKVLKMEARYRLKNKKGILVFSRPDKMKDWCDDQEDISYDDVKHLFVDAGKSIPGYSSDTNGVDFFVHSPFASEQKEIDRNGECIIVQATFNDTCQTKLLLGSDGTAELWKDIVNVTKFKNNEIKLEWDLFHISHHCSYLSLNTSGNKGDNKTTPLEEIKWLFETQGNQRARIVSSSKPIPIKDSDEDKDDLPPHRQSASYYKDVIKNLKGEFKVTMEYPKTSSPKKIQYEIDKSNCMSRKIENSSAAAFSYTKPTPRAGDGS